MTRFASATPAGKAAILVASALLLLVLWAVLTTLGTLIGLGRLGANVDFAAVPGWLWVYRGHPQVQLWFKVSALGSGLLILIIAAMAALRIRRPLHGSARWANEGEIRREGLRAKQGIILGRKGAGYLVFGGNEHVMLYAPTRTGKGVGADAEPVSDHRQFVGKGNRHVARAVLDQLDHLRRAGVRDDALAIDKAFVKSLRLRRAIGGDATDRSVILHKFADDLARQDALRAIGKGHVGSVAEAVLREAKIPVLVLRTTV